MKRYEDPPVCGLMLRESFQGRRTCPLAMNRSRTRDDRGDLVMGGARFGENALGPGTDVRGGFCLPLPNVW
jgi:hypothetical protein